LTPQNRIPELDLLRGFCILVMIAVHAIYDLTELYAVFTAYPPLFALLKEQGGAVFFLIAGISATLGRHSLKRGLQVFFCGLAASAVTAAAGFLPIRFGVLHCLGVCMMLQRVFRAIPSGALPILGAGIALLGAVFARTAVSAPLLYPLGLTRPDFQSADYFPLFPFLGYFLAGGWLGRTLYAHRRSLFSADFSSPLSRFLRFCGRHSLLLYLAHQPVLIVLIEAAIFTGGVFLEP